jgi:mono/diheme cytochrome c family protein
MQALVTRPLSALLFVGLPVLLVLAFAWLTRPQLLSAADLPRHEPDPLNGERLFHAGGCASCHGTALEGGLQRPSGPFACPTSLPTR